MGPQGRSSVEFFPVKHPQRMRIDYSSLLGMTLSKGKPSTPQRCQLWLGWIHEIIGANIADHAVIFASHGLAQMGEFIRDDIAATFLDPPFGVVDI